MRERQVDYPDYRFQKTDKTLQIISEEALPRLERIPQGEVIDLVTEIGMFYGLPKDIYLNGIGIPAFRTDIMTLNEMMGNNNELLQAAALNFGRGRWLTLISDDKTQQEKKFLAHELIHGLRRTKALPSRTTLDQYAHYGASYAQESVVTILETAFIYKDVPLLVDESCPKNDTILRRVLRERIEMPYSDQVVAMLALMQGTRYGSNPMTLTELADRYFNDGLFFMRDLMRDLRSRIPQEDAEAYQQNFEMLTW